MPYVASKTELWVSVDDEDNILKMNKRMFKKSDVDLNTCRDRAAFLRLLGRVWLDAQRGFVEAPRVYAVMDHMLDRDHGFEIIKAARDLNA